MLTGVLPRAFTAQLLHLQAALVLRRNVFTATRTAAPPPHMPWQ